ncbi:hypothetical protein ABC382_00655 [Lysinibacillus sp. 1P01SD]|uniref:hypothetical protein n=1 Tax=Lysinibacillus sp. 1P01SD TaxID=3132285 RepID=UPI00399FE5D8
MKAESGLCTEEKILSEIQQVLTTFEMNAPKGENPLIQLSFNEVSFLVEQVIKSRSTAEQLTKQLNVQNEVQRILVDLSKQFKTRGKNHKKHNLALVNQILTIINTVGLTMQTSEPLEVISKDPKIVNLNNYNYNKIPSFEEIKSYYHNQS